MQTVTTIGLDIAKSVFQLEAIASVVSAVVRVSPMLVDFLDRAACPLSFRLSNQDCLIAHLPSLLPRKKFPVLQVRDFCRNYLGSRSI